MKSLLAVPYKMLRVYCHIYLFSPSFLSYLSLSLQTEQTGYEKVWLGILIFFKLVQLHSSISLHSAYFPSRELIYPSFNIQWLSCYCVNEDITTVITSCTAIMIDKLWVLKGVVLLQKKMRGNIYRHFLVT